MSSDSGDRSLRRRGFLKILGVTCGSAGAGGCWEGISLSLTVLMVLTVMQALLSVIGLAIGPGLWD